VVVMSNDVGRIVSGAEAMTAHREIFQYWMAKCGEGRLPSRRDIDPKDFKKYLPTISLIDVANDADGAVSAYRMRLAGTALRDLYAQEITGKDLDDVFDGEVLQYWRKNLDEVKAQAKPAAGAAPLDWRGKDHLVQVWLRLPLASDGQNVNMILAFDAVVAAGRA